MAAFLFGHVVGVSSANEFKTHAGQVAVQKVKIGGAGFFLIMGGQQVDSVQGGDHLVFTVELVVARVQSVRPQSCC